MSIAGRALFGITQTLRKSRSLELLQEIRSMPFCSREEILAGQLRRLGSLLRLAEAHVPYYRELFRTLGMRSADIRTLDDFAKLPILTKDIIRERFNDLVREDIPKTNLMAASSGGSTGVPLNFYRDRSVLDCQDAATYRNLLQAGWRPGGMIGFFWGWDQQLYQMSHWEFEVRQRLRRQYQFDPFHSGQKDMDQWLRKWRRIKPTVAFGYASTIARFARHIEERSEQVRPLRGVFTTAEKLYQPQREVISRVFGCHVYDCYGSSEVANIASECPHGRMHVNTDFVVLEIDANDVAKDETPSFLVTSFCNQVMPFIRYRNGDCGELVEGNCDCGNQFPVMRLNVARVSDNFVFPDGRVVHGEYFTHLMYGSAGISMFQFHQTALNSITLWIVPSPGESSARQAAIQKVVAEVEALDPLRRVQVDVQEVETIPLSAGGKHRFTRSEVRFEATTARNDGPTKHSVSHQ
jgi:phenylacetate-CoA ligase